MMQGNQLQMTSCSERGRWTKEEHQKFVQALSLYGKKWEKVQQFIGTRSTVQIRSHAQKYFNRLEKNKNIKVNKVKSQEIKEVFSSIVKEEKRDNNNKLVENIGLKRKEQRENNKESEVQDGNEEQIRLVQLRNMVDQELIWCQIANILSRKKCKTVEKEKQSRDNGRYQFKVDSAELLCASNEGKKQVMSDFPCSHPQ